MRFTLFLAFCVFTKFINSQILSSDEDTSEIYTFIILDKYTRSKYPSLNKNEPNFLQIDGRNVTLSATINNDLIFFKGLLCGLTTENPDSLTQIQKFYARGRNYSIGEIRSFQLHYNKDKIKVVFYSKFGLSIGRIFEGHYATEEKIEKIRNFLRQSIYIHIEIKSKNSIVDDLKL